MSFSGSSFRDIKQMHSFFLRNVITSCSNPMQTQPSLPSIHSSIMFVSSFIELTSHTPNPLAHSSSS